MPCRLRVKPDDQQELAIRCCYICAVDGCSSGSSSSGKKTEAVCLLPAEHVVGCCIASPSSVHACVEKVVDLRSCAASFWRYGTCLICWLGAVVGYASTAGISTDAFV